MDTTTTAAASAALTSPLWLQTLNPYVQFAAACLGAAFLAVRIYYTIKNKGR